MRLADHDPDASDAAPLDLVGDEAPAVELDRLTWLRDVLEGAEHEPGDRVPVLVREVGRGAGR